MCVVSLCMFFKTPLSVCGLQGKAGPQGKEMEKAPSKGRDFFVWPVFTDHGAMFACVSP